MAQLARAGADFLVCPDNTIHQAFPDVAPRSPLPWLHIAEVVAAAAVERGLRRLALLGTRALVESEVYPEQLARRGLTWMRPEPAEREEIDRLIFDELVLDSTRLLARPAQRACAGAPRPLPRAPRRR